MSYSIFNARSDIFGWKVYLPEGYLTEKKPLVIFLHGAGERGADIEPVSVHGPFKLIAAGWRPDFICVAPQCPEGLHWTDMTVQVHDLILDTVRQYGADPDRVYLTGLSMGGFGTWAMLSSYAALFAAAVPICGGGQPWTAFEIGSVPIWAFHGEVDSVVNCRYSQDMVNAVNAAGGSARLTLYPGVDHDSWTRTYDNAEVWSWLLSQNKTKNR